MESRRELDYTDEEKFNEPFFLILISRPIWDNLKDPQRRGLVNHELMHCQSEIANNGEIKLAIIGHDFEAFHREFQLHGLWRKDAQEMLKTLKNANQLKLDLQTDRTIETEQPPPKPRPDAPTGTGMPVVVH
jgi:hypothetical protein